MNGQHNKKEGILFRHLLFIMLYLNNYYSTRCAAE